LIGDAWRPVFPRLNRDDDAGTRLAAFDLPSTVFIGPQELVIDDLPGLRGAALVHPSSGRQMGEVGSQRLDRRVGQIRHRDRLGGTFLSALHAMVSFR
jgi:hypothetical protein